MYYYDLLLYKSRVDAAHGIDIISILLLCASFDKSAEKFLIVTKIKTIV